MSTIISGASPYYGQAPARVQRWAPLLLRPSPHFGKHPSYHPEGDWPRELWAEPYGMHGVESAWKVGDFPNFAQMLIAAEAVIASHQPHPPMIFTRQKAPSGQWMSWFCRDPYGNYAPPASWFMCPYAPLMLGRAIRPRSQLQRPSFRRF